MFFPMTPEMINHLNDLKNKAPMTFEAYYNKRFMEECKYFVENPKFSMKYAMIMSYLQKDIKEKALIEYNEKWPGSLVSHSRQSVETIKDNESVISDYDIIDENTINEDDVVSEEKPLRRSKRLQTKFI